MNPPESQIRLKKPVANAVRQGFPWIFANDILPDSSLALLTPGALVHITDPRGAILGVGYYNPHTALACRLLAPGPPSHPYQPDGRPPSGMR